MSGQLRFLLGYERMVAAMLAAHPADEAMARAVGGDFERVGTLEHAILRAAGLRPDSAVVDVGCGSGRLAARLARHPGLRYLGLDVVPALLDYARARAGRPDFDFAPVDRPALPVPDASADIVAFFSVFTHLLHEESYTYLRDAHRALRPGGAVVFSFLEYATRDSWGVFEANLAWVRDRHPAGHLNVFMHRDDIRLWAARLGFAVEALHAGDRPFVAVGPEEATAAAPAGGHAFGQSVCVLRKPAAVGARTPRPGAAAAQPASAAEEGRAGRDRPRHEAGVTGGAPGAPPTPAEARRAERRAARRAARRAPPTPGRAGAP